MKYLLTSVSALIVLASVAPANAAGSASQGLTDLRQLNEIVFTNVNGNGNDTEGKAFIGGNLQAGTFNNNDTNGNKFAASSFPSLTVGGNVSGNVNINNANSDSPGFTGANIGGGGGTYSINAPTSKLYVGATVGNYNANGQTFVQNDAGLQASIAAQTTTFVSDLKALSSALAALPTTAGSSYNYSDQNNDTFTAVDGGQGYAVINVTAGQAAFNNASNFVYNIPHLAGGGYLPTIINISGSSSYTFNANSNNSAYDPYVIFNFENATSVTFNREVNGSVLAPFATVSNSTPIEGSLVANTFNQGGEVHVGNFLGGYQGVAGRSDPAYGLLQSLSGSQAGAVPEPATWAMMLGGFGLAGAALRRRSFAAA